jgi:hypothetical protein
MATSNTTILPPRQQKHANAIAATTSTFLDSWQRSLCYCPPGREDKPNNTNQEFYHRLWSQRTPNNATLHFSCGE